MKRRILFALVSLLWSIESVAQIGLNLNSSNFFAYDIAFHNPAGIVYPQRIQGAVATQLLYAGLSSDNLRSSLASYVQPFGDNAAFGLRGVYFASQLFQQGNFSLLFSRRILGEVLSFGLNTNLLTYSYNSDRFQLVDPNDPVVARGHSKNAVSVGMGILFRPSWALALGASIDHLNNPDISIDNSGVNKRRLFKLGMGITAYPFMPQLDLMMAGDEVLFQGSVRQSFLDQKVNFLVGYDSGLEKKDLFLEANFVHGQFGLGYSYQYPLNELNQITGGSHRVTLLFSQGGFPRIYSTPTVQLDNPQYSSIDSSTTLLSGKISNREGVTAVEILRNGKQENKLTYQEKPKAVNLQLDVPVDEGKNEIQVIAYGEKRQRSKKIWVTYLPPSPPVLPANFPVITILSPKERPTATGVIRTAENVMRVECEIQNVDSLIDVRIKVNGSRLETEKLRIQERTEKGFKLREDIDLREGQNQIEVQAINQYGSTKKELAVFYNPLLLTSLYRRTWAIIIGINKYRDPGIDPLGLAVNDARGIEKMLRDEFQFDRIITLYEQEATKDRIVSTLSDSLQQTDYDDGVFIFFAGHGFTIPTGKDTVGGIIPYDGAPGSYAANIPMQLFIDTSRIPHAKHIFYVMDACYSGVIFVRTRGAKQPNTNINFSFIKALTSKPVRYALTAGGAGEEILDNGRGNHSFFTARFLEGLQGAADENQDSYVTAAELGRYVQSQVIEDAKTQHSKQTPQFGKLTVDDGEFVFVRKF